MSYREKLVDARLYAEKRLLEDYPEAKNIMNKTIDFSLLLQTNLMVLYSQKRRYNTNCC